MTGKAKGIFTLFFVVLFTSCSKKIIDIGRIKFSFIMPIRVTERKGIVDTMSFFVSYYDHYRLYELPYHKLDRDETLTTDSIKYNYFICNSNNAFGYVFDNVIDSFLRKVNKDSILKPRAVGGGDNVINLSNINIIGTKKIGIGNKFILKNTVSDIYYDSLYLHFDSNLKDIKFCLSKSMDSMYNSKLYKFEMFLKYDSIAKANPQLTDFFVNRLEIKKEKSEDEQALINLFKRFKEFDRNQK